jgi:hypothetical protein
MPVIMRHAMSDLKHARQKFDPIYQWLRLFLLLKFIKIEIQALSFTLLQELSDLFAHSFESLLKIYQVPWTQDKLQLVWPEHSSILCSLAFSPVLQLPRRVHWTAVSRLRLNAS